MACRFYLFDDNLRCMSKAELVTTVETEFGITYTDGALTFGAAYDSGQGGATTMYGDEAELVISAGYTGGDVTLAAKGTDQDEMEVSVTFAF